MVHGNPVHLAGRTAAGRSALNGHTSIWMFPIYGLAAVIGPLSVRLRHWPVLLRGCFYGAGIMLVEFISGSILRLFSLCPWDYSKTPYNISGLVRLDYFPVWFTAGLIFEYILSQKRSTSSRDVPLCLTLLLSDAGSDWYIFLAILAAVHFFFLICQNKDLIQFLLDRCHATRIFALDDIFDLLRKLQFLFSTIRSPLITFTVIL